MKKSTGFNKKNKGFTLLEVIVVLIIGGYILSWVSEKAWEGWNRYRAADMVDQVSVITKAANSKFGKKASYSGVSMTVLKDLLPTSIGDGSGTNPWGGNYTITAGTPASTLKITVSQVPTIIGAYAATQYSNAAYASASSTLTINLEP